MICPHCKHRIPTNAQYCEHCERPVLRIIDSMEMTLGEDLNPEGLE